MATYYHLAVWMKNSLLGNASVKNPQSHAHIQRGEKDLFYAFSYIIEEAEYLKVLQPSDTWEARVRGKKADWQEVAILSLEL